MRCRTLCAFKESKSDDARRHRGPGLEYWRPSSPPNTNCPFFTQEITREHQVFEAQRLVLSPSSVLGGLSPHLLHLLSKQKTRGVSPTEGPTVVSNAAPTCPKAIFFFQDDLLFVPPHPVPPDSFPATVSEVTLTRNWDFSPTFGQAVCQRPADPFSIRSGVLLPLLPQL